MRPHFVCSLVLMLMTAPANGATLDQRDVNDAKWSQQKLSKTHVDPLLIKAQILLSRARFSPGEIDGKLGDNFNKAVAAFATENALDSGHNLTEKVWEKLISISADPVLTEHTLTKDDVDGPFIKTIPAKMEEMKDLPALSYTSAREKIAERFHMSEALLATLNPNQRFDREGDKIIVASVGKDAPSSKAARIEVDKTRQTVKVFGKDQKLIALYPATAGSAEKPAPNGRLKVVSVAQSPTYRYNPKYAFKGVKAREPFTIKPGPNNPVGMVWIGLTGEGYGIHGTPDPSKVSKTESHGCVRLTNWDALQLASLVAKGIPVDFFGDERAKHTARSQRSRKR